jgi:hypothetical protein
LARYGVLLAAAFPLAAQPERIVRVELAYVFGRNLTIAKVFEIDLSL